MPRALATSNVMYRCKNTCNLICSCYIVSGVLTALPAAGRPEPMERLEMPQVTDGMPATLLRGVRWTKSSHSNPFGNCVEVAELTGGKIAVRNSRHPGGPALIYTRAEMAAFVQAVKEGEFDETAG